MPTQYPINLILTLTAVVAASLTVWVGIASRLHHGEPLVPFSPRRDVPWGPVHLVLILGCVFLLLRYAAWAASGLSAESQLSDLTVPDKARLAGAAGFASLLATCGGIVLVTCTAGASRRDLGLPANVRTLRADTRLGALAFLAVALPVYAIHLVLVFWQHVFDRQPVEHPLVEILCQTSNPRVVVVAVVTAVCVAPVFEEFLFRLILQGWLEKVENRWLESRRLAASAPAAGPDTDDLAAAEESAQQAIVAPVAAAPTGAWPIMVSSGLFAMMHVGHGFDPVPLFVLAMALGYLYHRTHRITPSIVLHLLFNAFSLGILWLRLACGIPTAMDMLI